MTTVSMTVNGKAVTKDVERRMLLSTFLRDELGLTGTHVGCDTSQCGCCVVHVDGDSSEVLHRPGRPGQWLPPSPRSKASPTDGTLHPMQEAFRVIHGRQCGFCMTWHDHVRRWTWSPRPRNKGNFALDYTMSVTALQGNICRCTATQHRQGSARRCAIDVI